GIEAIVDHLLVETGGVLLARQPLLADSKRNGAVAKQARADVVVVSVETKDIRMLFGHWHFRVRKRFSAQAHDHVETAAASCRSAQPFIRRSSAKPILAMYMNDLRA